MSDPTVELIEGHFYWVKKAYEDKDLWTVARWEHGCFWGVDSRELTPRVISGPIRGPAENSAAQGEARQRAARSAPPHEQNPTTTGNGGKL